MIAAIKMFQTGFTIMDLLSETSAWPSQRFYFWSLSLHAAYVFTQKRKIKLAISIREWLTMINEQILKHIIIINKFNISYFNWCIYWI